jgi:hypothetical protein
MAPSSVCRFAAEVFHGLYDEVMTASARGHGLVLRVQQLEAELPLLEKDICQRDYLYVASNRGWFSTERKLHHCKPVSLDYCSFFSCTER